MNETKPSGPIDGFFLFIAEKFDGKKTATGVALIIGGLATVFFTPDYAEAGYNLIALGVPMLFVGLAHKAAKKQDENK